MKLTDAIWFGFRVSRKKKKRNGYGMALLVIAVMAVLFSGSLSSSYRQLTALELEAVAGREIYVDAADTERGKEILTALEEHFAGDGRVLDIRGDGNVVSMDTDLDDGTTALHIGMALEPAPAWLEPYMVEQTEAAEEEYTVIVPLYLSSDDPFDTEYIDGRDLIGKEISLYSYFTTYQMNMDGILKEPAGNGYELDFGLVPYGDLSCKVRVTGVYDNIALNVTGVEAGFYTEEKELVDFFILNSDINYMLEITGYDGANARIYAATGDTRVEPNRLSSEATALSVLADTRDHAEELLEETEAYLDSLGLNAYVHLHRIYVGGTVENMVVYIIPACSYVILFFSVFSLILESSRRTAFDRELIGTQAALGYRKPDLLLMRLAESVFRVIKMIIPCIVFYLAMIGIVDLFIRYKMNPIWYKACLQVNVGLMAAVFFVMAVVFCLTDIGVTFIFSRQEPEELLVKR